MSGAAGKAVIAWSYTAPPAPPASWQSSGTSLYYNGGNIGIGTSSPGYKLDVAGGNINAPGLCIANDCKTAWAQIVGGSGSGPWLTTGTTAYYTDGRVGIGAAFPDARLTVRAPDNSPDLLLELRKDGPAGGNQIMSRIDPVARIATIYADGSNGQPRLSFGTGSGGPEQLTILPQSGNVGVGMVAPSAKLHVAGNVIVDGNIGAKYQDVAEWVPTSADATPGTVVIADPTLENHVRPSDEPYATTVLGVVSAQPGVLLGERSEGAVAVAQSGRVRVKVDATYGAVKPGDLLVSSPTPGHAMRSESVSVGGVVLHRPGTILGKALSTLSEGRGEVLVLLTLQ